MHHNKNKSCNRKAVEWHMNPSNRYPFEVKAIRNRGESQ